MALVGRRAARVAVRVDQAAARAAERAAQAVDRVVAEWAAVRAARAAALVVDKAAAVRAALVVDRAVVDRAVAGAARAAVPAAGRAAGRAGPAAAVRRAAAADLAVGRAAVVAAVDQAAGVVVWARRRVGTRVQARVVSRADAPPPRAASPRRDRNRRVMARSRSGAGRAAAVPRDGPARATAKKGTRAKARPAASAADLADTKLGAAIEDIDLNLEDFELRVNADLVGKIVNIASRCAGFITKRFDGRLASDLDDSALIAHLQGAAEALAANYEAREFSRAMRDIMALADRANQYIDRRAPWIIAKDENRDTELQAVCSMGIFLFRILLIYLKPVLPGTASRAELFLGGGELLWGDAQHVPLGARINKFEPLMQRVEREKIKLMINASKEGQPVTPVAAPVIAPVVTADAGEAPTASAQVSIEDFAKIDLRVARIVDAKAVEGADKLVQLTLDIGTEQRNVFAGIKAAYAPEALIGRQVVMVANLAPRKMRFGVSEGMVLAAGPGGADIFLLNVDTGAEPGQRVK